MGLYGNMHNLNKKGLTLIELVVAMGLFGIIMVALYPAFLLTNLVDRTSKEFTDASTLAQDEIEYIYNASTTLTLTQTIADIDANRGYTCNTTTHVCTKTTSDFNYVLNYTPGVQSQTNLSEIKVVVNSLGNEVNTDGRAEIRVILRIKP